MLSTSPASPAVGQAAPTVSLGPLNVTVVAQLSAKPYSFNEKCFRFNNACFGGDHYLCIRAESDDQTSSGNTAQSGTNQVAVIDFRDESPAACDRRTTRKCDGGIKHPLENVLALRGASDDTNSSAQFVQVFNLETKERLGEHQFDEPIVFWKWFSNLTLAIVTESTVYHWYLRSSAATEKETEPEATFTRSGKLETAQIINYTVDDELDPLNAKWCLLAGISLSQTDKKQIVGSLQLFSIEKQQQQFLDGHSGCFGSVVLGDPSGEATPVLAFLERKPNQASKLYVMDIYSPRAEGHPPPFKISKEFTYPSESPNDFPISQCLSATYGLVIALTKGGYCMLFDAKTATKICHVKVSEDTIFLTCPVLRSGGMMAVNRKGGLISIVPDEKRVISQLQSLDGGAELASSLARRYGYSMADDALTSLYRQLFSSGRYKEAARVIACMKSEALRTPATLNSFKQARTIPNEPTATLQYFSALLASPCRLTAAESIELLKPIVAQNRVAFAAKFVAEDKLTCTEALGDLVRQMDDRKLALKVYQRCNAHSQVVGLLSQMQDFNGVLNYIKRKNYKADFTFLLRNLISVDEAASVNFAKSLLLNEPQPLMDVNLAIDVFLKQGKLKEITSVLIEVLKPNRQEDSTLQTRLFEIALAQSPNAAETVFQLETFTHFDRPRIAQLCEKAGLHKRALELFTDLTDIKRVMNKSGGQLNEQWLQTFLEKLPPATCRDIMIEMVRASRANVQPVVRVAIRHHDKLGVDQVMALFEEVNSLEGMFYFLGGILAFNTTPAVHNKYIEVAAKLGNLTEVDRMVRESKVYDAERVKDFLMAAKLSDPRPLIYVCDHYGYISELTEYLYRNHPWSFIEVYVTKVNTQQAPSVLGTLFDLGANEADLKSLLDQIRGACSVGQMVLEMEKRGRLMFLQAWMEAREQEGCIEEVLHNALAKIYIETNQSPEKFLTNNNHYNPKTVGLMCCESDPQLAVVAFTKGNCSKELIDVTNKNQLYRAQAKYLVHLQDAEAWASVLQDPANLSHRKPLVEQVIASGVPEATTPEEIASTVEAFTEADMPRELLELLEKIILQKSLGASQLAGLLASNTSLQNLLLVTAMKATPSQVGEYINRLDKFDAEEVGRLAESDSFKLYNEALQMYKKCDMHNAAMDVLVDKINNLEEAARFAETVKQPYVWTKLGKTLMAQAEGEQNVQNAKQLMVKAIRALSKAEYRSNLDQVVQSAEQLGVYDELVPYLMACRESRMATGSALNVDSELLYCLAKCSQWDKLDVFLAGTNTANIGNVGDRLYDEGCSYEMSDKFEEAEVLFQAALRLFTKFGSYSKLAPCQLKLHMYEEAVESARKAGVSKLWREVCFACIAANKFDIAHIPAVQVVTQADHLDELVRMYENKFEIDHLLHVLESVAATSRANSAVQTELGIVYANHRPEKLADHIRACAAVTSSRLNVPKLVRACEANQLWNEASQLHIAFNDFDQAILVSLAHFTVVWNHETFCRCLTRVANTELYYKSISFYLDNYPLQLCALLSSLKGRLDNARAVACIKKHSRHLEAASFSESPLAMIQSYLEGEQAKADEATNAVNEALHELYLADLNVEALHKSILKSANFDQLELASRLEKHKLLELRRLSVILYRRLGRFDFAVTCAQRFSQFDLAIAIAKESESADLVERVLRFFVEEKKSPKYFAAALHRCHDLVRPEVAIELAWLAGFTDQLMPFLITYIGSTEMRVKKLELALEGVKKREKSMTAPHEFVSPLTGLGGLALLPPAQPNSGFTDEWTDHRHLPV